MRRPCMIALVVVLFLAVGGALASAQANPSPEEFKAKLDEAVGKLAAYDVGGDGAAPSAINELVASSYGKPEQRKELAARLAVILPTAAPYGAKNVVCRQLALIGSADEVPALAGLLADEKLSHMARYALERIPGPAADAALRDVLGKLQGKLLIGMINSLGNRKAQSAVGDLAKLLSHQDATVAAAAAAALGKIGPSAADVLGQALATVPGAVRPAVADGCMLSADALAAEGKRDQAIALYDRVRSADVPAATRIAAARGAILARGPDGTALVVEAIQGTDIGLFRLALSLIRYAPQAEFARVAAAELARLPSEKQIAVLQALADRGEKTTMPAVLALAKQADPAVRPEAIQALARLGDAGVVPVLLEVAASDDPAIAQAAAASLARLADKRTDPMLLDALAHSNGKVRLVAIGLLGQRRVLAATPLLLKAAADADESVRLAALRALADTAGPQDVDALVGLVVRSTGKELAAAQATLGTACARMPDREACAERVAAALAAAGAEPKSAMIQSLGQIGGAKALAAVQGATKDGEETVRDAAVRVLADWQDAAAAPELLALSKATDSPKVKILALRGYIRLIGQRGLGADTKLAMCREALPLAERPEEKRLVLGALGGVHNAESLALVVPCLDDPALKNEAAAAALSIGERLADARPAEVAEAMNKVLGATENPDLQKRAREVLERAGKK